VRVSNLFAIAGMIALGGVSARAETYSFIQLFPASSFVQGTFSGTDLNIEGRLDSRDGEITSFFVSYSGSQQLVPFTLGIRDLQRLVYETGTPVLGDAAYEGIAADTLGGIGFSFVTGRGPTTFQIGFVGTLPISPGTSLSSDLPVMVTQVPELSTWLYMLLGLFTLTGLRRCLTPRSS
jgi:hypothetical protein